MKISSNENIKKWLFILACMQAEKAKCGLAYRGHLRTATQSWLAVRRRRAAGGILRKRGGCEALPKRLGNGWLAAAAYRSARQLFGWRRSWRRSSKMNWLSRGGSAYSSPMAA